MQRYIVEDNEYEIEDLNDWILYSKAEERKFGGGDEKITKKKKEEIK